MNVRHICQWSALAALLAVAVSLGLNKTLFAQPETPVPPAPAESDDGQQVLTRGPVHEAFAETVTFNPEPGIVVPKTPPAAIEEIPPEQRPDGTNVAWIPGYWGWDDEQKDFIWISGVWRDLPPGRQWVPGYWGQADQGIQWTSGYWADAKDTEVEYLPEPPASVEVGPSVAATSADQTWLPGCWVWQTNRYAWRPGFWATVQPDWVWTPAHYVWAPRGYVFVDGYWDYAIGRRGVLFAPMYFSAGVYGRPGFSYSPSMVIDLSIFSDHLFFRPRYQHYYFGDYYAASYGRAGFYASYAVNSGRFGYDPIFAHNRWQHRHDRGWDRRVAADFMDRRNREDLRPPRTWAAQRAMDARAVQGGARNLRVATPYDDFRKNRNSSLRFQAMNQAERQRLVQQAKEVQRFGQERQKLDNSPAGGPARAKLPGSPIVAKSGANVGKGNAPPKTFVTPKLDPNVVAAPRAKRSLEQPKQHSVNRAPLDKPRTQLQPPPKVKKAPQSQPQAKQPAQAPQPKAVRQAPAPQPKAVRQAPAPQPKAVRQAPPPKVERQAPPPKAERRAPPPQRKEPAGGQSGGQKQDQPKGKDKK